VPKSIFQCAVLFHAFEGHRFKDILCDLDSSSLNLCLCQEICMATFNIYPVSFNIIEIRNTFIKNLFS
jgi:hypothetical protein